MGTRDGKGEGLKGEDFKEGREEGKGALKAKGAMKRLIFQSKESL